MIGMLAVASAVVLSGCGGDDDDVDDLLRSPAAIYFHNQITDTAAADATSTTVDLVARNNLSSPLFEQRPYSKDEQDGMSFKLNADTESVLFDVNNSTTTLVDDASLSLSAGEKYTLVAMGQVAGAGVQLPTLKLYPQSRPSVSSGTVKVRVINALSERADQTITVTAEGNALTTALAYGEVDAFAAVTPSDTSKLAVTINQSPSSTVSNVDCLITLGKSYDVIVAMAGFGDATAVDVFCQQVHGS